MPVSPEAVLLRLALAVLFGAAIGLERQWHHKHAGVKTHALVVLGSTAFSLVSVLGMGPNSAPTQLAVGVLTGIGFLGGGVIMRRGASIQGLTTAASLWSASSLGLALGSGYYGVASALFVAILLVLLLLKFADNWVEDHSPMLPEGPSHKLAISFDPAAEPAVRGLVEAFTARPGAIVWRSVEKRSLPSEWELELALVSRRAADLAALARELGARSDVLRVEWGAVLDASAP
jgi:putative Mg2+ transporter-C (MgtC) family protein